MIKFLKQLALGLSLAIVLAFLVGLTEGYTGWNLDYWHGLIAGCMWMVIWFWDDIRT